MKPALLELRSVTIGYRGHRAQTKAVARNLTATLRSGELVCLLGPNGAGKSTLLRTIAAMSEPLEGQIVYEGRALETYTARELARTLSVVLTQRAAVGTMPVETLVGLGRYPFTDWAGRMVESDRAAVEAAMATTGIQALAQRPFIELSDGEQQKAMIARALAQEPRVMILDEPTAFLDLPRRVELVHLLRRLAHDNGRAVLMSTHELDLALRTADRLWLLSPGGPLVEGAPEDLVMQNALSRVFESEAVGFDDASGAFRVNSRVTARVSLSGAGAALAWTARALERASYRVETDSQVLPRVEIENEAGAARWRVFHGNDVAECSSIEAMLDALRGCSAGSAI